MGTSLDKRIKSSILKVSLMLTVFLTLAGCDYKMYPQDTSSKWVSTEPPFVLEYRRATNVRPYEKIEYFEIDGIQHFVDIDFAHSGYIYIIPMGDRNYENLLLMGTWRIRGDEMVFKIEEDNIFNGAYQKIYFVREELES